MSEFWCVVTSASGPRAMYVLNVWSPLFACSLATAISRLDSPNPPQNRRCQGAGSWSTLHQCLINKLFGFCIWAGGSWHAPRSRPSPSDTDILSVTAGHKQRKMVRLMCRDAKNIKFYNLLQTPMDWNKEATDLLTSPPRTAVVRANM